MNETETHQDRFCDLRKLSEITCLCPNTLKNHMKNPTHPLPHYKLGGKLLVKWSEFCAWMDQFKVSEGQNLNDIIEEVTRELQ